MIYCCYFVPREGAHPTAVLSDYAKLWPIMHRSLRKLGHQLVHITDMHTPSWGDSVARFNVDPATTVYSRDVAWLRFVESLPHDEHACMIEPDTMMLKDIPPIKPGFDMVLLSRPQKTIPGWFKLARRRAVPFLREVVSRYDGQPDERRVFHGDIFALHRAVGLGDNERAVTIPSLAHGVRIEIRDWTRYGFRKSPNSDPFFLQFKGTSKHEMLRFHDAND